ncbi:haloacid dehalogenase family hydrolase domain containing protein [Entamoeba histolytica HM-3:IMSS]|nr:haloacid dehalogenase family hydrolase domain containing protein [Entamoeba histolytica HM-3:IMSS]GAT97873.1 hypothetical protein CL6EHI_115390 [Entamoeba histolytica]
MLKFKCLMLDHDDTSVDSTPNIHYPCYLEFMKTRPNDHILTYQEWFKMLWYKGLFTYYREDLHLSEDEIQQQLNSSRQYTLTHEPAHFFPGFIEMLKEFRRLGGIIGVVSFSDEQNILRHYRSETNGEFVPDIVYGWNKEAPEKCKPYAFPVLDVLEKYHLEKKDILVVDDLLPGLEMAKNAGVKKAGALYGKGHEFLREEMEEHCDFLCETVTDLKNLIIESKKEE